MHLEPAIDWNNAAMAESAMTLNVPVSHATTEWREEFKRAVVNNNREFGSSGWGEILLIGDRLVVSDITSGSEARLKETLERLVVTAQRSAVQMAQMRNAARDELKQSILTRERTARAMQDRFRSF